MCLVRWTLHWDELLESYSLLPKLANEYIIGIKKFLSWHERAQKKIFSQYSFYLLSLPAELHILTDEAPHLHLPFKYPEMHFNTSDLGQAGIEMFQNVSVNHPEAGQTGSQKSSRWFIFCKAPPAFPMQKPRYFAVKQELKRLQISICLRKADLLLNFLKFSFTSEEPA